MAKKIAARTAYVTVHPKYGMNTYWIRSTARAIRHENGARWETIKKMGWRIVRVKVTVDDQ